MSLHEPIHPLNNLTYSSVHQYIHTIHLSIRHVKRLGASNVFIMLGSNLVQAAAAVTQFDPTIRLRYKNQRKKEGAPSRLT